MPLEGGRMKAKYAALELAQKLREIGYLEAIILFGSAARDEMHKKSDIDILLLFNSPHNPETGEEASMVHRMAGEIEMEYKLENSFSFVFMNRGEKLDSDFLWEVARDGMMLYCKVEKLLGQEEYLKPMALISYQFKGMAPKDKMYVKRRLYGYQVRKNIEGKEYLSEGKGIVTEDGRKIGRATFMIDAEKSKEIIELFEGRGVKYSIRKIWV